MKTKKDNFKRLAEARTEKVLAMLDLIGNLSNKSFYEYTDEEVEKIFKAISKSVEENKNKFKKDKENKKRRFTL
jgi:ABC-type Fe3+-hydroxamate transport system substrate-binding protein